MVYSKFSIVNLYDFKINGHSQSFSSHHEEVACISIHPDDQLVASGEEGPKPEYNIFFFY